MRAICRTVIAVALAAAWATAAAAAQTPPPPVSDPSPPSTFDSPRDEQRGERAVPASLRQNAQPEPQDRFVPLDELPPEDRLPAAPLLITAYAFVLLALFGYLLTVATRLGAVKREVERLERDLKKSGRA